jgi:mono/diheme cytochrome c family protein
MYDIDPNVFMNGVVMAILAVGALIWVCTIIRGLVMRRGGRLTSYLSMLSALIAIFAVVVGLLGFRGQTSGDRPWHFLLDMKYQPKYTAQGESEFFADGRAMQLPPTGTVPFDGTDFWADAGFHPGPSANLLQADARYYRGIADPGAKDKEPEWTGGQLVEGYFVGRIPDRAVAEAGGWDTLIKRGRQQFNVHCGACHGASGRGGSGTDAHGIVGAYNLSVAPADVTATNQQPQPDGQLFHTISQGKGQMPGYGHQIKVADRWAIVSYVRVLQFARK